MIVVDVGSHAWEAETSVDRLIARFDPSLVLAFDPYPEHKPGIEHVGVSLVVHSQTAAWRWDGTVGYLQDGIRSRVVAETESSAVVWCFDLASLLAALPAPVVLKLDVEGAEYELLPHLYARGADALLDRLLVEWHGDPLELGLRCPVEAW